MEASKINEILGITESFQMPEKLMALLISPAKDTMMERFLELESDLSFDWFTDYFQEEHSNRNAFMQDYTPRELTKLLPMLSDGYEKVLDVCAGIGGLTIGAWNHNPDVYFVCEELSERALPLLLFNLSIRNMNGCVMRRDVLSGEIFEKYYLEKGDRFSSITIATELIDEFENFDLIISNPPYSVRHEWDEVLPAYLQDYGAPPTKAADYAFVLYGLSKMKANGKMFVILPHGVLFRGQRESDIRKALLDRKQIRDVVGLPDKLFLNTQIPVCIMSFEKQGSGNILMVDASKHFEKNAKQNRLREKDILKISEAVNGRLNVDKYSRMVPLSEIIDNAYNLNIPRYVDTSEEEPLPDINEIFRNLADIETEIIKTQDELWKMLDDCVAQDVEDEKALKEIKKYFKKQKDKENGQLIFDL